MIIFCEVYIGEGKKGFEYSKQANKRDFYLFTSLEVSLRLHEDIIDICTNKKMVL